MKQMKTGMTALIGTALTALAFVSCFFPMIGKDIAPPAVDKGGSASSVITVTIGQGEELYLVKFNPSGNAVEASKTGEIRVASAAYMPMQSESRHQGAADGFSRVLSVTEGAGEQGNPAYHKAAMEFNAKAPPVSRSSGGSSGMSRNVAFTPPPDGSTRQFWVQDSEGGDFVQITAKYVKNSDTDRCRVWVSTGSAIGYPVISYFENLDDASVLTFDNKITTTQAKALAQKFNQIYDKETALFGYEKGGGPGGDGGIDGDPLVNILIYDIDADHNILGPKVIGYFWGKDEYSQADLVEPLRSNMAEIFYIDSSCLDSNPAGAYSTLIHEFQHMIQYNTKTLRLNASVETWYNEMLSMLAEDMLAPSELSINTDAAGHPAHDRIPYFNSYYWKRGVTDWFGDLYSYANVYAFGAYLARNYGGAKLIELIATNNAVNIASINDALKAVTSNRFDFYKALEKFPETLLYYQPSAHTTGILNDNTTATYLNTVSGSTVSFPGYDFDSFEIDTIRNLSRPAGAPNFGPAIWPMTQAEMRPYGIDVQKVGMRNLTADFTFVYYPGSPVKMYLVRKTNGSAVERMSGVYP
ncbi:MAG: hypothetical protein Pg6C_13040 [Treponemataceae bacterium]|nr:MAG: hypothetical protein Pg6C_13040 [Treponemataceae bacterium]